MPTLENLLLGKVNPWPQLVDRLPAEEEWRIRESYAAIKATAVDPRKGETNAQIGALFRASGLTSLAFARVVGWKLQPQR